MVAGLNFEPDKKHQEYIISYSDIGRQNQEETSIFSDKTDDTEISQNVDTLNDKLSQIHDSQGCISKSWDKFKDLVNLGVSTEDCDEAIEKYKNGEITYEEASQKLEEYKQKQDGSLNLFSNIATSITSIVAATAVGAAVIMSGGTAAIPLLAAVGAGTGALTKLGFKLTDRATNEVKDDALDAKQMIKDGLSGAVTGSIAAATMGTGSSAETMGSSIIKSSIKGAKTGAVTGSISGAANYSIDSAFDEDKEFKMSELIKASAENAVYTAAVGGVIGGTNGALRYSGKLNSGGMITKNVTGGVKNASKVDIAANSLCSSEYKIVNDRFHAIAS